MKIFVCVEDNYGMAFLGRRLSRDSRVSEDIIRHAGERAVYMSSAGKKLFPDNKSAVAMPLSDKLLKSDDYYFFETESPISYLRNIDEIVLYRWNRRYPSDLKLGFLPEDKGYTKVSTIEFVGTSHECITKEVYRK